LKIVKRPRTILPFLTVALCLATPLMADDAAGTAHIEAVDIEKDGRTSIFEIELTETGKLNREVSVTADGTLHDGEYTMPLTEIPDAAMAAIKAGAKGAVIKRVQHITRVGKVTDEALYVLKGKPNEVEYLEDGTLKT